MALIWHGGRAEGLYWIGEMGENRGKEEVSFVISECGIKPVVVIELRKWL